MPLESQFSVQVTQPYLNNTFPIRSKEPHDDRIFKHITFPDNHDSLTLRLRTINRNYITESSVLQKQIRTNISSSDLEKDIFRVKAVLSQSDHGILESHWVTQKEINALSVSTHNQYRIRGISRENWKSDWVYSELRDAENDLIIYNMLYDILDLLMSVHDDQIDYVMDYIVRDTFLQIIKENIPQFSTSLEQEELLEANIEEIVSFLASHLQNHPKEQMVTELGEAFLILSRELKKEFQESVMASPLEFSDLYRSYRLLEQYQHKKNDALYLLVDIFLEDRLEKILQNADIEVLLQNQEEMGIYLNGKYDFNIKNELITSMYHASPNENFVTSLNDAVQLLSEPIVYEHLVYQKDESVEKFMRLALRELYAPFAAIDIRLAELEHALEDAYGLDIIGNVIEYATKIDDYELRNLLLNDIISSVIQGDLDMKKDYEIWILDHMLNLFKDSRKALLIEYRFPEFFEVIMDIGESFRHTYRTTLEQTHESMTNEITESSRIHATAWGSLLKESYTIALQSTHQLAKVKDIKDYHENTHIGLLDYAEMYCKWLKKQIDESFIAMIRNHVKHHLTDIEQDIQEDLLSNPLDIAWLHVIQTHFSIHDESLISLRGSVDQEVIISNWEQDEYKSILPKEVYHNLFKHHLRDPNKYRILEKKQTELSHELRDVFKMDGTDIVQYALGDITKDWPLGVFRLGTNTLKGEVSNL